MTVAGTFDGGWTIEAAVPFKSIRYAPGTVQDWGFQARRSVKSKNEIAYLTNLPPSLGLGRADFSASLYANLVGLEAPPLTRTLELKPYAIAAAIGSCNCGYDFKPASRAASRVPSHAEFSNFAGTVITAASDCWPTSS